MPDEKDGQNPTGNPYTQPLAPLPPEATIEQRIMALEAKVASQQKEEPSAEILGDVKTAEWWLIGINGALLIATIVIACIYYGQLQQMRIATGLTGDAVKVARDTLTETQSSNTRQAALTDQARKSSEEGSKRSLQAAIDQFRQDQRAWVSIGAVETVGKIVPIADQLSFGYFLFPPVNIQITNTGKTPALKLAKVAFFVRKDPMSQPPDYDIELAKLKADKTTSGVYGPFVGDVGVLAPTAIHTLALTNDSFSFQIVKPGPHPGPTVPLPGTLYLLGKLTYYDIFTAKQRTTKFCLWSNGEPFRVCSKGNWMD